jgi:N-acetylneuraminic acid mutarotase
VVGTAIIVLGGRNGRTSTMTTNEIYDTATGQWRQGADVPTGRSGVAAVSLGGYVYFFGGEQFDRGQSTFDEAERYDPTADQWARLPDMPTPRHGLAAAAIGGQIYVVSGGPEAGFAFSDIVERLTP